MFRFYRFAKKSNNLFNLIPYEKQYETRDFIRQHTSNQYINYYKTKEFKQYKPNLKSTYK